MHGGGVSRGGLDWYLALTQLQMLGLAAHVVPGLWWGGGGEGENRQGLR